VNNDQTLNPIRRHWSEIKSRTNEEEVAEPKPPKFLMRDRALIAIAWAAAFSALGGIRKIANKVWLADAAETCVEVEHDIITAIAEDFERFRAMTSRQRSEFAKAVAYKIIRPSVEYSNNERKVEGDVRLQHSKPVRPKDPAEVEYEVPREQDGSKIDNDRPKAHVGFSKPYNPDGEDEADKHHGRPRHVDLKLSNAQENWIVDRIDRKRRGLACWEESPMTSCIGRRHFEPPASVLTEYELCSLTLTGSIVYDEKAYENYAGPLAPARLADLNNLRFFWHYLSETRTICKSERNRSQEDRKRFARLAQICKIRP